MIDAIKGFFKSLFDPVWDAFQRLFDFLNEFFNAMVLGVAWAIDNALLKATGLVLGFVGELPCPDFVIEAGDALQGIPSSVLYFSEPFHIGAGLTMVITAYVLRFAIRRIPLIG